MGKFFTTASADFVHGFVNGALERLSEEHASLRGPRMGTKIVIEDDGDLESEDTTSRSVVLSTRVYPDSRTDGTKVVAQGIITKQGDRWTSAVLAIQIPGVIAWRISGQMDREGKITYFAPRAIETTKS